MKSYIKLDQRTGKNVRNTPGEPVTLVECEKCGTLYDPGIKHFCDVPLPGYFSSIFLCALFFFSGIFVTFSDSVGYAQKQIVALLFFAFLFCGITSKVIMPIFEESLYRKKFKTVERREGYIRRMMIAYNIVSKVIFWCIAILYFGLCYYYLLY